MRWTSGDKDYIVIGGQKSYGACLEPATGKVLWEVTGEPNVGGGTASVGQNHALFGVTYDEKEFHKKIGVDDQALGFGLGSSVVAGDGRFFRELGRDEWSAICMAVTEPDNFARRVTPLKLPNYGMSTTPVYCNGHLVPPHAGRHPLLRPAGAVRQYFLPWPVFDFRMSGDRRGNSWSWWLALLWASAGHLFAGEPVGWNGNWRGDFVTARPPVSFNGETGVGVRWKTKLPNWSNSSPLVVETVNGPRVVLLSEPTNYAPVLLCLDADTGKELWRRELDAVPLLPATEQAAARDLAQRMWNLNRLRKRLTAELQALYIKDKTGFAGRDTVPAAAEPIVAAAKAAGFEYRGISQSAGGYPAHFDYPSGGGIHRDDRKRLDALGLMASEWDYQGTWDGVAYPTPISDGARIWTITSHNLYSCHDFEGKIVWQVRFPPAGLKDLTAEQRTALGDTRWPGRWPGAGGFSTSPLMADGKLVSCAGAMVRCLDAVTGKVLWAQPMRGQIGQALGVPGLVEVDGEKYVVGVGNEGAGVTASAIHRLRDGVVVARLPGITSSKGGMSGPVTMGDVVVNRPGHEDKTLTAFRLVKRGDVLEPQALWR